jgi:hypothetical protein
MIRLAARAPTCTAPALEFISFPYHIFSPRSVLLVVEVVLEPLFEGIALPVKRVLVEVVDVSWKVSA